MEILENSHKTKFQIERIAFFSDAIFAIAITLMVIDVKPPRLKPDASFTDGFVALLNMTPDFIGVILSFILISVGWWRHHQFMQHLINYTSKLIWLNLFFLFSVMFIPFSTEFVFQNPGAGGGITLILYNLNYTWVAISYFMLFKYVINKKHRLIDEGLYPNRRSLNTELLYYPIFVYVTVSVLALLVPFASVGYILFAFQGLVLRAIKSFFKAPAISEAGVE